MASRLAVLCCLAAVACPAGDAAAQPAPSSVNDCTLIGDPVALRNCILRFEGQQTPSPPTTLETGGDSASPPAPAGDGSPQTTQEAEVAPVLPPPPPPPRSSRRRGAAEPAPIQLAPPSANPPPAPAAERRAPRRPATPAEEVRVEQIQPAERRRDR